MVATGLRTQSMVVLSSLVGEMSGLAALATNGALTNEAAAALQVTHFSAAVTGLSARAGALPATDQAFRDAMRKVNFEDVLDAEALIKRVVDGGVPLPDGTASTKALLASATAVKRFASAQRVGNRRVGRCGGGRDSNYPAKQRHSHRGERCRASCDLDAGWEVNQAGARAAHRHDGHQRGHGQRRSMEH
jgi:hypothetical protein